MASRSNPYDTLMNELVLTLGASRFTADDYFKRDRPRARISIQARKDLQEDLISLEQRGRLLPEPGPRGGCGWRIPEHEIARARRRIAAAEKKHQQRLEAAQRAYQSRRARAANKPNPAPIAQAQLLNINSRVQVLQQACNAAIAASLPAAEEAALRELMAKAAPPPPAFILDPAQLPRRRLDALGNTLPDDVTEGHVITHFPTAGLMFDIRKPQQVSSLAAAQKHAGSVDLLDRKGDWTVGTDHEMQILIDRDFHEPAVNKNSFPNMPSSGWVYTSRKTAWSSDLVWFVYLSVGYVNWYYGVSNGVVVPVLRVPASQ